MSSFARFSVLLFQLPFLVPPEMRELAHKNVFDAGKWFCFGVFSGLFANIQAKKFGDFLTRPLWMRLPIRFGLLVAPIIILYPLTMRRKLDTLESLRTTYDREYLPLIHNRSIQELASKLEGKG